MSGIPEWPIGYFLKRLMQKTTSPAYDADTDSNEAIAEAVATVDTVVDAITLQAVSTTTAGTIVQDSATGAPTVADIVSDAAGDTFGAWVQLDASAATDVWISHISLTHKTVNSNTNLCVEVGTGAGGAEATKMRVSYTSFTVTGASLRPVIFSLPVPIKVASGTRIAARLSSSVAAENTVSIGISTYTGL